MIRPGRFYTGGFWMELNHFFAKTRTSFSSVLVLTALGLMFVSGCGEVELPELVRGGVIEKDGQFSSLDPSTGTSEKRLEHSTINVAEHTRDRYQINYGDRLRLYFHGNNELSGDVIVRADGFCTFPRIGDLGVTGLDLSDLSSEVNARYEQFYIDPEITLSLVQESRGRFFVLGEVMKPGAYILEEDITVLAAVASSGGFRSSAESSSIILVRSREPLPPESYRIDLSDVINGEDMSGNPFLRASDIIYVPESFISKVDGFTEFLFGNFLPPVDSALRGYYYLNTVETRNRELELIED